MSYHKACSLDFGRLRGVTVGKGGPAICRDHCTFELIYRQLHALTCANTMAIMWLVSLRGVRVRTCANGCQTY